MVALAIVKVCLPFVDKRSQMPPRGSLGQGGGGGGSSWK